MTAYARHREQRRIELIGAPSSAGAYAPGQEKAPGALRAAGLIECLRRTGREVIDRGDVPGFAWRPDRENPRAMNLDLAAATAASVASEVAVAISEGSEVIVLGGDCTVGIGTVAGALQETGSVGLIYVDLDTDLNTPASTSDGALDWMGVAHLLSVPGTVPNFNDLADRAPLLAPDQIAFFASDNVTPFERGVIEDLDLKEFPLSRVAADPRATAQEAVRWAHRFERLLIHLDVDVLDFADLPIAENDRRNRGLRFDQLLAALRPLLAAPNHIGLTVTEVNPDHAGDDESVLRRFVGGLGSAYADRGDG